MGLSKEQSETILRQAKARLSSPARNPHEDLTDDCDPMEFANSYIRIDQSGRSTVGSSKNRPSYSPLPQVYVPKGINVARFYRDCEGQYLRTIHIHKVDKYFVLCPDPAECEICEEASHIPSDWAQFWDYRRRERYLAYAWLHSFRYRPPYVKLQEPILLYGYEDFGRELRSIIDELGSEKALQKFFDPQAYQRFVTIKYDPEFFRVTMDWSNCFSRAVPPLPGYAPPLSQCMWPADRPPGPKEVGRFMKKMAKDCEQEREPRRWQYIMIDGELRRV